jgi:hypothetical protein
VPQYAQDVYDTLTRSTDRIGRQNPRLVFNFATLARSIPGYLEQFSRIPDEFWQEDVTFERVSFAVIACPCGVEPRVEAGRTLQCTCERVFFFSGQAVMVANSPKRDLKPVPLDAEDAAEMSLLEPQTPAAS